MNLKWILFLIATVISVDTFGQKTVSELDLQLVEIRKIIQHEPARADSLAKIILNESLQIENDSLISRSYYMLGLCNYFLSYYRVSSNYYEKALETNYAKENILFASYCNNNLGINFEIDGEYPKATFYYLESLKVAELLGDSTGVYQTYINLGFLYSKIKDYDLSEDYLTKALRYFAQQEDLYNQALCYQNLGILTNYRGENELSLEHYEKATQLYQKLDNNKGILDIIINVINTRLDAQNLDQLETLLSQGMELANKIVEPYSQALLYNLYGNYYLQKRNFVAAEESLLKSEKLFLSLGANGNVRLIYNLLLQVYVQPGYESSFFSETLKKYDAVSVEIFDKERSKDLVEYNVIYETEKKENEILWLETIAITERYRRNVFLIFSLFGAIVSLLAILLLLKRHKRLKLQQILLNERNHHYKELLELKNRELATQSIQIAKRNESINNLIKKIKNYASNQSAESRKSILKITPMLKELTSSENGWWKEFELRFTQLNKDFLTRLLTSNPELSPIEIRICSLLRLNMGTKDIAEIMHNSVRTIENHRFRIRKKLQLDNTQSLTAYILNF